MANVTDSELADFAFKVQTLINGAYKDSKNAIPTIEVMRGQRYARLVRVSPGERSAYGFVDMTNGDLLKAAGWKGPAKGRRGGIRDSNATARCSAYSIT
jgi:hypothetical protein